jgi:hypothetical protein
MKCLRKEILMIRISDVEHLFSNFLFQRFIPKTYNVMITLAHNKNKIEISLHGSCITDYPKDSRIPGP